ncbi:unnamed protein product [Dicrocoelium dendriticum]|nr:unnamed protein product [Dicrocoelium dendriticum]
MEWHRIRGHISSRAGSRITQGVKSMRCKAGWAHSCTANAFTIPVLPSGNRGSIEMIPGLGENKQAKVTTVRSDDISTPRDGDKSLVRWKYCDVALTSHQQPPYYKAGL